MVSEDVDFTHHMMKDMESRGCVIDWKQASFVVKFPDPGGSGQKLSLLVVPTDGNTYLRNELGEQLRSLSLPSQIANDLARDSAKLFSNCEVSNRYPASWSRPVSLKELRRQYGEFMSLVQKTIDRIREAV